MVHVAALAVVLGTIASTSPAAALATTANTRYGHLRMAFLFERKRMWRWSRPAHGQAVPQATGTAASTAEKACTWAERAASATRSS
ncbi:hypothetical protein GCM10011578_054280 [Streptomyces fuscichromogenes]|uniref:Secreted protein n=1 Tax=Streptomyces fuscichromogenes TaxID=1324013 RepID=A0A918CTG7_9ACTN|nr:hypothetical protein GCM10011578_054280 [Streptomyces fuscichromogenes]